MLELRIMTAQLSDADFFKQVNERTKEVVSKQVAAEKSRLEDGSIFCWKVDSEC